MLKHFHFPGMANLAIACALVCLILLGSAIVVGFFGIIRPQISAVLVTGVIYVLSATFALFTLTIVHSKHKNRNDFEPLDVWRRLIPELGNSNEFRTARVITHGGSLQLAWAGEHFNIIYYETNMIIKSDTPHFLTFLDM